MALRPNLAVGLPLSVQSFQCEKTSGSGERANESKQYCLLFVNKNL